MRPVRERILGEYDGQPPGTCDRSWVSAVACYMLGAMMMYHPVLMLAVVRMMVALVVVLCEASARWRDVGAVPIVVVVMTAVGCDWLSGLMYRVLRVGESAFGWDERAAASVSRNGGDAGGGGYRCHGGHRRARPQLRACWRSARAHGTRSRLRPTKGAVDLLSDAVFGALAVMVRAVAWMSGLIRAPVGVLLGLVSGAGAMMLALLVGMLLCALPDGRMRLEHGEAAVRATEAWYGVDEARLRLSAMWRPMLALCVAWSMVRDLGECSVAPLSLLTVMAVIAVGHSWSAVQRSVFFGCVEAAPGGDSGRSSRSSQGGSTKGRTNPWRVWVLERARRSARWEYSRCAYTPVRQSRRMGRPRRRWCLLARVFRGEVLQEERTGRRRSPAGFRSGGLGAFATVAAMLVLAAWLPGAQAGPAGSGSTAERAVVSAAAAATADIMRCSLGMDVACQYREQEGRSRDEYLLSVLSATAARRELAAGGAGDVWVSIAVDSACATTMMSLRSAFQTMRETRTRLLTSSNERTAVLDGEGAVQFVVNVGYRDRQCVVERGLFAKGMSDLLSVGDLRSMGCGAHFPRTDRPGGVPYIDFSDGDLVPLREDPDGLFYLDVMVPELGPCARVSPAMLGKEAAPGASDVGLGPDGGSTAAAVDVSCECVPAETDEVSAQCGGGDTNLVHYSSGDHGLRALWHRRLAHVSDERVAGTRKHVRGLPEFGARGERFCACCAVSKQRNTSSGMWSWEVPSKANERVHLDVFGPMQVVGHRGERFVAVMVDAATRYAMSIPVERNNSAAMVRVLRAWATECGMPRQVHTDRGSEYEGAFREYCADRGIRLTASCPHRHDENGLAERYVLTNKNMMRALIVDSRVPLSYWPFAVRTATYIHNRLQAAGGGDSAHTPYQRMFGAPPELAHMRVFGSTGFVHQPKERRTNEYSVADRRVFVGYDTASDAYLMLDPVTGSVLERRAVMFDENWVDGCVLDARLTEPVDDDRLMPGFGPPLGQLEMADGVSVKPGSELAVPDVSMRPRGNGTRARYAIDIGCGTSSALRYRMATDEDVLTIGVDVLPRATVVAHIPLAYRARFKYHRLRPNELMSVSLLRHIVAKTWGGHLGDVDFIHFSPECQTLSLASRGKGAHRGGLSDEEDDESRAVTRVLPKSPKAVADDRVRRAALGMMAELALMFPTILMTIENPVGLFKRMPEVVQLASTKGWQLLRSDHCATVLAELGDGDFPKKPTDWLVFNVQPGAQLPTCGGVCGMRLPPPNADHHKLLLCEREGRLPEQQVMCDQADRSRIPLGVFGEIARRRLRGFQHSDEAVQAPVRPDGQLDMVIWATGKQPGDQFIRRRLESICGRSWNELRAMKYKHERPNGSWCSYRKADFTYDLDHGYIEVRARGSPAAVNVTADAVSGVLVSAAMAAREFFCDWRLVQALAAKAEKQQGPRDVNGPPEPWDRRSMLKRVDKDEWLEAERVELESLERLGAFRLVQRKSASVRPIDAKMVYKQKPERKKARLVACGFAEPKSPSDHSDVVRLESIRMLLAKHASSEYSIELADVQNAFCCSDMPPERPAFINIPKCMTHVNGVEVTDEMRQSSVIQLMKGLYGLRRSPALWASTLETWFKEVGFVSLKSDQCVFRRGELFVAVYVDDVLACGPTHLVKQFMGELTGAFKCRYYQEARTFLGCEISRARNTVTMSQSAYVQSMSERFLDELDMPVYTPASMVPLTKREEGEEPGDADSYRSLVGGLLYASHCTRPDITFAVMQLARHVNDPSVAHMRAARRVLSYLNTTRMRGLTWHANGPSRVVGYSDASWNSEEGAKSVSSFVFMLRGAAISYSSKLQSVVALSSSEAEYVALSWAAREAIWLRELEAEVMGGGVHTEPMVIFEDNTTAAHWAVEGGHHQRQKHISVYHHFIRDAVKRGLFSVVYIGTAYQLADVNTKLLPYELHSRLSGVVMGEMAMDVPRSQVTATNVAYDPVDAVVNVKPGKRETVASVA